MFDQFLKNLIDPKAMQAIKDGMVFFLKKLEELVNNSREQTRLLADILEAQKENNRALWALVKKKGGD